MADPTLDPGTGDGTGGAGPDRGSITGMPRWVKTFLIVALVVVLLVVILLLAGGGHGPGRHRSGGDGGIGPDRGWTTALLPRSLPGAEAEESHMADPPGTPSPNPTPDPAG